MHCCLTVIVALLAHQWVPASGLPTVSKHQLDFLEKILSSSVTIEQNPLLKADYIQHVYRKDVIEMPPVDFQCNVDIGRSPTRPTSVHAVRPGDIDVVAAFGDSISAGNGLGATNLPAVAIENRGEVWSIGGDRTLENGVITLPNIIKKFNPDVKGYSICASTRDVVDKSWFNMAEPGGDNTDMPSQAVELVERMKADSRVNYTDDWKLVTLFVGGNDLCAVCTNSKHNVSNYYHGFEQSLLTLKENLPRTIVNLVSMFDVSPVQNFSTGLACDLLQWRFCDCARNWTTLPMLRPIQLEYHEQLERLANDERFKANDFTVILQPHLRDMIPPVDSTTGRYVQGFLSPDCFHPNRIAHQAFAVWLWNTMLTPIGQKPFAYDSNNLVADITCPTEENPFIFTDQNSPTQHIK